ncbi:flagellar hook-length control protein FliK [Phenylobacterium sp.]|uniref:flagellar hook-length control protein FliK n=1 Tax=Phenylobacterium sp. TaxID=1871053 RepID=UPI002ED7DE5A
MTASAINTASNASAAGPAGAAASAKGAAGAGASAGFDALLAALFPQGAPAGAPEATAPGAVAAPQTAPLFAPAPDVEDAPVDESLAVPATEPQAAPVLGSDAAAMLATAQVAQPGPTVQPDQTTATTPAAHAWGRDKAKGAPAQPAILNANPRADLAGKLELAPEATDDASAPATEIAEEAPTGHAPAAAQRGLAQAAAKAAAPAAVVANAPAPPPTADIQLDAPAAPPPAPTEAVAPEAAAPDVAAPQAQALAASQSASKPEAPPAPAARSHRSDRAKTVAEAESHSDLKPLQAADKPVHAKAVDGAAKSAAASTEAKGPELAAPEAEVVADAPEASLPAETRAAEHSAAPTVLSTHAVRGSPETVAHLAAQIIKKLDGQTTRFDVELNPQGLGKVDVRVEIGAHGQLTASMLFDNAQSAQDLKSRAAELQRALEQAGFDLSGGLSFDVADHGRQQGQAWQDQDDNGRAFRGQAFRAALETAGDAADAAAQGALRLRRGVNAGLDLRI